MSRVGRKPITIPQGIKVQISGQKVHVEGPKGKLDFEVHPRMKLELKDNELTVSRPSDKNTDRALHGLTRSMIFNMVKGTSEEFKKELDIEGVGFRADLKGKELQLSLGYSHPINFNVPEGVKVEVQKQNKVIVTGADKELVGAVSAEIRGYYEPEPYKGKGVRYSDERVRRKAGKAAG